MITIGKAKSTSKPSQLIVERYGCFHFIIRIDARYCIPTPPVRENTNSVNEYIVLNFSNFIIGFHVLNSLSLGCIYFV